MKGAVGKSFKLPHHRPLVNKEFHPLDTSVTPHIEAALNTSLSFTTQGLACCIYRPYKAPEQAGDALST